MKAINESTWRIVGYVMACISILLLLHSLLKGRSLAGEIVPLACLVFLVFMLETNHLLRGRLPETEAKWPAIGLGLVALGQLVTLGETWLGVPNASPLALLPYLLIFVPTMAVAYRLSQRNGRTR